MRVYNLDLGSLMMTLGFRFVHTAFQIDALKVQLLANQIVAF